MSFVILSGDPADGGKISAMIWQLSPISLSPSVIPSVGEPIDVSSRKTYSNRSRGVWQD
jgi:hypothetical protein